MQFSVIEHGRRHWFYLLLPLLLAIAFGFRATHPWAESPVIGEATALFDWCLFVPCLYAICYRDMPRRALAIRVLGLVCAGIWIAGLIVPVSAQTMLAQWGWLRGVGIAVLVAVEGWALVAVLRVIFSADADTKQLERQGIPPLLAQLMLAEARFWRWLWRRLRGR